jgi:hypothetical protein
MVDRQAISDLIARYCTILDSGEVGKVGEVFTEDGVDEHMGPPSPTVQRGRAEINQFFVRNRDIVERTVHCASNITIEVDGDTAKASWYATAWHWLVATAHQGFARPADVVGLGVADDELRRTPEGWLVAHRVIDFKGIGVGGFPDTVAHAFQPDEATP